MNIALKTILFSAMALLLLFSGGTPAHARSEVTGTLGADANHAPLALNKSVSVKMNGTSYFTIDATDADGDPLTYSIVSVPSHGTLSLIWPTYPRSYQYTPALNYLGNDSFTFKANDGKSDSNVATISITVDNVKPMLSAVSIVSNNPNPALAKIGDLITISFTASEPIWPSVTINGYIWALTSRVSEQNWTAAYTMKSTDTSGEVKFNIRFQDLAGNIGDTATTTSDHSMVLFDKTSP